MTQRLRIGKSCAKNGGWACDSTAFNCVAVTYFHGLRSMERRHLSAMPTTLHTDRPTAADRVPDTIARFLVWAIPTTSCAAVRALSVLCATVSVPLGTIRASRATGGTTMSRWLLVIALLIAPTVWAQPLVPVPPVLRTEDMRVRSLTAIDDTAMQQVYDMSGAVCQVLNGSNSGAGSGTLIWQDEKQGVVLTAKHVVGGSSRATCTFRNHEKRVGIVHTARSGADCAIVHIRPVPGVTPVPVAEQNPQIGAEVIAMGYGGRYEQLWAMVTKFMGLKDSPPRFSTIPSVFISGDSGGLVAYNGKLIGVIEGYTLTGQRDGHGPSVMPIRQFLTRWWPNCPPGGCQPYPSYPQQPSPRQRPSPQRIPVPEQPPTEPLRPTQPQPKPEPQKLDDEQIKQILDMAAMDGRFKGDKGDKGDTGQQGPQGPAGRDGTPASIDAAVSALLAYLQQHPEALPPIYFRKVDGRTKEELTSPEPVYLGEGIEVHVFPHSQEHD